MDLMKTLLVYMMLAMGAAATDAPAELPAPTPAPTAWTIATPAPLPQASYTPLFMGDRGEEVKRLQEKLIELGYLTGKADGIYGKNTRQAVTAFQENNDLPVSGNADEATLALLYEDGLTPDDGPTAPQPTFEAMQGVTVPVYYVDQDGKLLARMDALLYGSADVYADGQYAGEAYVLASAPYVSVTVRGRQAVPASVTFQYRLNEGPQEAAPAQVPVYYVTDTGSLLYQTAVHLEPGVTAIVEADPALVPSRYALTGAGTVQVSVSDRGKARPASVAFTFHSAAATPAPGPGQAALAVQYVNETGFLLAETTAFVPLGETVSVEADPALVTGDYRLVSQSPVQVTANADGEAVPAIVIFTYSYQAPEPSPANP